MTEPNTLIKPGYAKPVMSPLVITAEEAALIHRIRQLRNSREASGVVVLFEPFQIGLIGQPETLHKARLTKS